MPGLPFSASALTAPAQRQRRRLAIPNVPTLAGQVFHQQVLPVTFAATGGLLTVASTNWLTMVIGSL